MQKIILFFIFIDILIQIFHRCVPFFVKPKKLPRLKILPQNTKVAIVIPAYTPEQKVIDSLVRKLKIYKYANPWAHCALLLDTPKKIDLIKDNEIEIWTRVKAVERKRGALLKYAQANIDKFDYIITLDADTILPRGAAEELTKIIMHPKNAQHKIIAPRIETSIPSANATFFAKTLSSPGGIDTYSTLVSETFQDIFGSSNFCGKGIFHVKSYIEAADKFPANCVLSHDIIEGFYLNCAYSSDVIFLDSFPRNPKIYFTRAHRWIRGDWQNLIFLFKKDLSLLAKIRLIDNLRQSLNPIFYLFYPLLTLFPIILNPKAASKTLAKLLLLPLAAFTSLHAITVTLFRILTKKNLLEWSPSHNLSPQSLLRIPQSHKRINASALHTKDHETICHNLGSRICDYFATFSLPELHYLAPDNVQESPSNDLAARTSPTNIGMQILATISAYDLEIITHDKMHAQLTIILDTLDKLPKWHGNLYNWYNLHSLKPLHPIYVSSVDSGNFLACCIIAAQFDSRFEKIIKNTNLTRLYDQKRNLFSIGFNAETNTLDKNHYDLLATEARTLSYVAIALNQIPYSHWHSLARPIRHKTLISWGGSMFEYLMPLIFMPNVKHTLLNQTYKNVVKIQKQMTPWGISESAYNKLDNFNNYQYKSHGIKSLSLAKNKDNQVISPYSSILALMVDSKSALKNLCTMNNLGYAGKYGFYEAIDNKTIVRSYMVHHLGMSICAINNYINNNILQQRFMNDIRMASCALLLEEKPTKKTKNFIPPKEKVTEEKSTIIDEFYAGNILIATFKPTTLSNKNLKIIEKHSINAETHTKKIIIKNPTAVPQHTHVHTHNEIVLTHKRDYYAHPAFMKMFIRQDQNKFYRINRDCSIGPSCLLETFKKEITIPPYARISLTERIVYAI